MAKSVVNQEFVQVHSAALAPYGFVRRAPGQRRMADLLPAFLFMAELPAGYSVEFVGYGHGYGPGGNVLQCEYLVVLCPCGTRIPAARWVGLDFNVCQDFNYVPA